MEQEAVYFRKNGNVPIFSYSKSVNNLETFVSPSNN